LRKELCVAAPHIECRPPSLPGMNNLSNLERQRALDVTAMLAYLRREGKYSEEKIAQKLGFGSLEAMRIQLRNWELPRWLTGSLEDKTSGKPKRKAREGKGDIVELPPTRNALPLFEELLDKLRAEATWLSRRTEYLKDERFVVGHEWITGREVPREKTPVMNRYEKRDFSSEEEWEKFCREIGEDPAADVAYEWLRSPAPGGASPVPLEPLVTFCALHALMGGETEALLERLHPDLSAAPREQLAGIGERLRTEARRYATGIRGGDVRTGQKAAPLTKYEQEIAAYVNRRRHKGVADEQILEELNDGALWGIGPITLDELKRLGGLRLD
jgi:hypothetical protein